MSFNTFANLLTVVSGPSLARLRFVIKDLANMLRQGVSVNRSNCHKNMLHQISREKMSCIFEVFQQVGNWSFHVVYSKVYKNLWFKRKGITLTNTSFRARTVQLAKT